MTRKFKKGDILRLKKELKVDPHINWYHTYPLKFMRYEKKGGDLIWVKSSGSPPPPNFRGDRPVIRTYHHIFLELDPAQTRDNKIKKILNK